MKFNDPEMKIAPYTAAEIAECSTPQGIRAYLNRKVCRCNNFLLHNIFDLAYVTGLSGEDKYTVLAFEALKRAEDLQEQLLDQVNSTLRVASVVRE